MWVGEASRAEILSFAFTPDGTTMYTGDDSGCILAWDQQAREYRELYELPRFRDRRQAIWQIVVSAKPNRLFIPANTHLHILALPQGTVVQRLPNTASVLPGIDVSPDARRILNTSSSGQLTLWDAKKLTRLEVPGALCRLQDVIRAMFIEQGSQVLVFRRSGAEVSMWNVKTGELVRGLSADNVWCRICALSPDRRAFAACGPDGLDVCVYDLPSWAWRTTIRHSREVESLAFHPAGELLAITDGTPDVTFWNTTTETKMGTWNWRIGKVRGVAFAPDGLTCVVGGVGRFAVFDVDV